MNPDGPLIVQSDKSVLLEAAHPHADVARSAISPFAELERAPEHVHTYRITNLALWNARAAGFDAETVVNALMQYSRYPVPHALLVEIAETMSRYGRLRLESDMHLGLVLRAEDPTVLEEVRRTKKAQEMLGRLIDERTVIVHPSARGTLKQLLMKLGWPAEDRAGYIDGEHHPVSLHEGTWSVRDYQRQAVDAFRSGGSGVVVMPCGSGKTIVGAAAIAAMQRTTLILVTSTLSARQWREELLARTTLTAEEVGEYSGSTKQVRPITIATYQVLAAKRGGVHPHLELMSARDWGLIIYDEVHLLPAPVFRMTADLQARRRLGLTATLVREDGREGEVFSLIGPKRYDAPWKDLEAQGYIAPATCTEVRVTMPAEDRFVYSAAEAADRPRLAATHAAKVPVVEQIVARHPDDPVLVIGHYLEQLQELATVLDSELITGKTPVKKREELFAAFQTGTLRHLVVSKVANFSINLPAASVAIQVSGAFGSRQEEAQRLGRILRPKPDGREAHFYTVVTADTQDQEFAAHRQRFLTERGYAYRIVDAEALGAALADSMDGSDAHSRSGAHSWGDTPGSSRPHRGAGTVEVNAAENLTDDPS